MTNAKKTFVISQRQLDLIQRSYERDDEDLKTIGEIGFMARCLVQTTLPHKDPDTKVYERSNGLYRLSILSSEKVPYGVVPRRLLAWITTEAVRTGQPVLELGRSQVEFMQKIGVPVGGKSLTQIREQSKRLFSSLITMTAEGQQGHYGLRNTLIVDDAVMLWNPKRPDEPSLWQSELTLSERFYRECINHPVQINLDVLAHLGKHSPLAMDVYVWLVYRLGFLRKTTVIPWASLALQFGSNYADLYAFKRNFSLRLKEVLLVYPEANAMPGIDGLELQPSELHIARRPKVRDPLPKPKP